MRRSLQSGQATLEYALLFAGVVTPVLFAIIYTAQLLWIWHSVVEFTREGAQYAATHCWQASAQNVIGYMQSNVPLMLDQQQFQNGTVALEVDYFSVDPTSGTLTPFSCSAECSTVCVPDTVTVHVLNYQFTSFVAYLGLPPVTMPDFQTSMPVESSGCDPEQGTCLP
ncbi:MAG TPA: TadE family protein [Bryobacteraceae bacterium]|nr:TadE family protein [Bryobacteraceae bacterium]